MVFIVDGQRIATENFLVGQLYKIIYKNENIVYAMCDGIGHDFVMFISDNPRIITLNVETAQTIESIMPAEAGSMYDYNDLVNKPTINNIPLIGNTTSSDLGLQNALNTAQMAAVNSGIDSTQVEQIATNTTAIGNKQDVIDSSHKLSADLVDDSSSTNKFATAAQLSQIATNTTAIAGKQNTIDSSHKLSADLVDDSSSTNKFATAAQLSQISTNETNISSLHNIDSQIRNEIDNNIYYKDMYGYTTGYYYTVGGIKTANPDWGYTELIPVDASTEYEVVTSSSATVFICFYDSNKTFISGTTSSTSITTPTTAAYVRISVGINRIDGFRFAKGKYKNNVNMIITCGENQQYTRLRDAVKAGVNYGATVIVYPGTYDLTQEFATELSTTLTRNTGIKLSNDVYIKFMAGAFVTANFDGSSESISQYFSPFIADENSSGFTLENAHIVASNCRYCVHDEHISQGTYTNRYINCHMEMTTTRETTFFQQAIGGGLGEHGTIIIEGGYYKSNPSYGAATYGEYGTAQNIQQPITYHNGSRQCYGHIIISNVYLADRGYLRFGSYGISTEKTPVEVSNCSFGLPILDMYETEQSINRNFGITAYNNVSRNTEVPFDFSRVIDIYTNSDDT